MTIFFHACIIFTGFTEVAGNGGAKCQVSRRTLPTNILNLDKSLAEQCSLRNRRSNIVALIALASVKRYRLYPTASDRRSGKKILETNFDRGALSGKFP
jgi:hypothetical protein